MRIGKWEIDLNINFGIRKAKRKPKRKNLEKPKRKNMAHVVSNSSLLMSNEDADAFVRKHTKVCQFGVARNGSVDMALTEQLCALASSGNPLALDSYQNVCTILGIRNIVHLSSVVSSHNKTNGNYPPRIHYFGCNLKDKKIGLLMCVETKVPVWVINILSGDFEKDLLPQRTKLIDVAHLLWGKEILSNHKPKYGLLAKRRLQN